MDRSDAPGPLIGSGRASDVYDIGDGKVLRRSRDLDADVAPEARVMRFVAERGYPVPTVHSALGRDLVMDRIDGPTMLDAMAAAPWKVVWYARRLARIQRRLARIRAPSWLLAEGADPDRLESVLHLDLHPMNVIMSPRHGPIVIDWANAAGGPAGFDAAVTYVAIAAYQVESSRDRLLARVFAESLRRSRGRRSLDPYLVVACDHRLSDRNTTVDERVAVAELRRRHVSGRSGRTRPRR